MIPRGHEPLQPDLLESIAAESRAEFELTAGAPAPRGVRRSSATYAALYDWYVEKHGDPVGALFRIMADQEQSDPKLAIQAAAMLLRFRHPQLRAMTVEPDAKPMRLTINMNGDDDRD